MNLEHTTILNAQEKMNVELRALQELLSDMYEARFEEIRASLDVESQAKLKDILDEVKSIGSPSIMDVAIDTLNNSIDDLLAK